MNELNITTEELVKWQWSGTWHRTFPTENPETNNHFLILEQLGIAERYSESPDYIDWKINHDRAAELHNQRLRAKQGENK